MHRTAQLQLASSTQRPEILQTTQLQVSNERCCLSYYHYIGRDPTATKKFTTGTFETLFPQNSNSKIGRGSAQILNLNFAAPAGPDRTTFPRPGRKMFAARGGENFVAGVRKSCGPRYLIAKGCAFSEFSGTSCLKPKTTFLMNFCPRRATKLRSLLCIYIFNLQLHYIYIYIY